LFQNRRLVFVFVLNAAYRQLLRASWQAKLRFVPKAGQ
jgi:hypothetical protein